MSRVIQKTSSTSQRPRPSHPSHPQSSSSSSLKDVSRGNGNQDRGVPYEERYSRKRRNHHHVEDEEEVEIDEFPSSKSFKRSNRKERCDLGMTCPYINEYQHRLEFDHEEQERIPSGRPATTSNPTRTSFKSQGNILGGYCVRSERNILHGNHSSSNKRNERLPADMPTKKQKKNYEQNQFDSPDSSLGNQHEPLHVTCDICHKAIDIYNWDMHALSHERNQREHPAEVVSLVSPDPKNSHQRSSKPSPRTSLRTEQDRDYESAVLEDIMKQSKREFEQKQNNQKNLEAKEEEILNGLLQTTSITHPTTPTFRSLKSGECSPLSTH